jgi:hypothetical protein
MEENNNIVLKEPSKGFKIILEIIRYATLVVYALWTVFVVVSLIEAYNDSVNRPENSIDGFALAYAILLLVSAIVYVPIVLLNGIGLVMSIVNKTHKNRKINIIYFICSIVVVIVSFIILLLLSMMFN